MADPGRHLCFTAESTRLGRHHQPAQRGISSSMEALSTLPDHQRPIAAAIAARPSAEPHDGHHGPPARQDKLFLGDLSDLVPGPQYHQIGVASYGADRAVKIGADSRSIFERFAGPVFGLSPDPTTTAKKEWKVARHGGGMISCGIDGRFNGERLDGLILDDLFKDYEHAMSPLFREKVWNWFTSTALPCVPEWGWILIVNTRWMPDDVIGRILSENKYEVTGHEIRPESIASAVAV